MKVRVAGNSHTGALWRAAEADPESAEGFRVRPILNGSVEMEPFSHISEGQVRLLHKEAQERLKLGFDLSHFDQDAFWWFVVGNINARFLRDPLWEKVSVGGGPGREVSDAFFRAAVEDFLCQILTFFDQLKHCGVSFGVVFAPPPLEARWADTKLGAARALSHSARAWKIYSELLDSRGIPFIRPPQEAFTSEGFLNPKLKSKRASDLIHGNEKYGSMMFDLIKQRSRSLDVVAVPAAAD